MGERGDLSGNTMTAPPGAGAAAPGAHGFSLRPVPDIPVIDPWTGQNFQAYGPHTAYMRWLQRQPGDPRRYRPADFDPLIAKARHACYGRGGHRAGATSGGASRSGGATRSGRRQLDALSLGLCCGWRALDRIQARWLHAWLNSLLASGPDSGTGWTGSRAERTLAAYCRETSRLHDDVRFEAALHRISEAGMTAIYENACRFECWRDVEMILMSAWRSGISLVDEEGYLLPGWKPRFALAFAMRFPEIS